MSFNYFLAVCKHHIKRFLNKIIYYLVNLYLVFVTALVRFNSPALAKFFIRWLRFPNWAATRYFDFYAKNYDDINAFKKCLSLANLRYRFIQYCRPNRLMRDYGDLVEIFMLAEQSDNARDLVGKMHQEKIEELILLAKKHFELGAFQESQQLLDRCRDIASILNKEKFFGQVLQIEDPQTPKNNSWYDIVQVTPAQKYQFTFPKVYPKLLDNVPVKTVNLPAEQIYHLKQVIVDYGSVVHNSEYLFLYEPAAKPCFDFVAGYWDCLHGSHLQLNHAVLYNNYVNEKELDAAIFISGRNSSNYFHWMIEYLARLYTVQKFSELAKLPLIVDENMNSASKEALRVVAPEASICWIDKKMRLKVNDLYIPSFHTFHPDHMQLPFWQISGLSAAHLAFVRDAAYRHAKIAKTLSRRIYLKRSTKLRGLKNIASIEKLLKSFDFEFVDPATLNFLEQVELFASAKYIVGVGGAAFTNLMFCQPGCVAIGLVSEQLEDFCMQSNIAAFAGCEFVYVTGISELTLAGFIRRPNYIHANFYIDPNKLKKALHYYLGRTEATGLLNATD